MSKKSSPAARGEFDFSKKEWKILNVSDSAASRILDGDPNTSWYQENKDKTPVDLTIDLGSATAFNGFQYLPGQGSNRGIISGYQFFISGDNKEWTLADQGEFANIKNNPLLQIKTFKMVTARFIRFRSLRTAEADDQVGYAEFTLSTK